MSRPYNQNALTNAQDWPFVSAVNYSKWDQIVKAFPHLENVNDSIHEDIDKNVAGLVIRSGNDDNVHKAIKYGIWTTTPKNKTKLQQLWYKKLTNNTDTYLFFSAVKSGMFEGVARLKSGYNEQTFPFWWENHTLKFKGHFQIEWIYIKDINNKYFGGMYNNEGEEVMRSKDCDTLNSQTTLKMLNVFQKKKARRDIFVDFAFMDERESQYIRRMYEMTNYYNSYQMGFGNGFDLSQFSLVNHPMNLMNNVKAALKTPQPPRMGMPPGITKAGSNSQNGSGFQRNPVKKSTNS